MINNVRIKDLWNEQRIFNTRTLAAVVIIFSLSLLLAMRLVWLQVVQYDYYLEQSQGNRVRLDPIPASRGLILDRNGKVLADNEPGYQLELVREAVPDLNATLARLAKLGIIGNDEIDDTRRMVLSRRSFDRVPIRLRMSDDEIGRFALHQYEFPGVELATRQTRHYPYGALGVHALGYVGSISEQDLEHIDRSAYAGTTLIGKSGVEASYEDDLHGKNGYREILVNAQGRSVQKVGAYAPDLKSSAPDAGEDLVLSIDLATQQAAENGLGANRGAVVAIDPRNGDVLALASHPGFDPGLFARGLTRTEYAALTDDPDKPLLNRALRGTYPSGSTIKPVIALAGLASKMVDPEKREFCAGEFHLPGSSHLYREGKGGKHGYVDLQDAIARSCDVYFYGLAARLGVDRIASFLAPFGFGQLTGIDIDGEKPGILPSVEWKKKAFKRPADQVWFPGETVNFGVGQGYLLVTPLQLAHIVSVIADRGGSFRPRLVTGVRDFSGNVKPIAPVQNPAITGVSDADWNIVIKGMVGATVYGTAAASGKGALYTMAGKTGTAQVFTVAQGEKYDEKKAIAAGLRDHALFIAFAPVDKPRIAVAVLAENAGFGASVAAPIARKVMDAYLLDKNGNLKP
ncbi:MAG TPA: penicillin-binding protein 2 [Steroidobacteraceae bacterium]|nr:penicillin-binding protein 2 [Steroidobacteraceae bacterium]